MGTQPTPIEAIQLPPGVTLKDATVNVASLDPGLMGAVRVLGLLHLDLFQKPLMITSGNDGKHKQGSKHGANKAVDIRTSDKDSGERIVWATVIFHLSHRLRIMMFDEEQLPGSDHIHIETAD